MEDKSSRNFSALIYKQLCLLYNEDATENLYKITVSTPEASRRYAKTYYDANREKILAKKKLNKPTTIHKTRRREKTLAEKSYNKAWAAKNRDKINAASKKWKQGNGRERVKEYFEENKAHLRASITKSARKARETLNDSYIRNILKERNGLDPTPELISLKRAVINFKRTKKELSNETI